MEFIVEEITETRKNKGEVEADVKFRTKMKSKEGKVMVLSESTRPSMRVHDKVSLEVTEKQDTLDEGDD